jgi:hypothetical protein
MLKHDFSAWCSKSPTLSPLGSMAPVVETYPLMRSVALLTAVTFVTEIGDVRRFETPGSWWLISVWSPRNVRPASGSDAVALPKPASAHQSLLNRRLDGPSRALRNSFIPLAPVLWWGCTRVRNIIDNEH